jgi:hypothetical protein
MIDAHHWRHLQVNIRTLRHGYLLRYVHTGVGGPQSYVLSDSRYPRAARGTLAGKIYFYLRASHPQTPTQGALSPTG